jgi:1,6-anhydro-N-acetylmuramate kinase
MPSLNQNLQKLFTIAQKHEKLGIGLMSGTSLDGLDIALCTFTGNGAQTQFKLINFITITYETHFKQEVQQVFAKKQVSLPRANYLSCAKAPASTIRLWQCHPANRRRRSPCCKNRHINHKRFQAETYCRRRRGRAFSFIRRCVIGQQSR